MVKVNPVILRPMRIILKLSRFVGFYGDCGGLGINGVWGLMGFGDSGGLGIMVIWGLLGFGDCGGLGIVELWGL